MIRLAAVLALLCGPAWGQACADRDSVLRTVKDRYGETQVGAGLSGNYIIEVWVSEETGTWTILRTGANGISCMMVSGEHWRAGIDEPPGTKG